MHYRTALPAGRLALHLGTDDVPAEVALIRAAEPGGWGKRLASYTYDEHSSRELWGAVAHVLLPCRWS